ncbi:MAG: mechanosensitive ion channel [Acidimicrobiales bacterium]|nr:mechanosensitive ion channel [Acidimicrobiales bacterium]
MDLSRLETAAGSSEAAVLATRTSLRLLAVALATLVALRVMKGLVSRIDDERIRGQMAYFVPKVVRLLGAIAGIAAIGVDVSGMAAVMATIGFTGAVVFTPVGQNLVAGAMVRIDDVCVEGDVVTVGSRHGTVVHRSLLRTELELPDGSKAWIPNSMFQDGEVLNHSRLGGWRITVQIPLDRSEDRRRAQVVMERVVSELEWNQPGKRAFVAFDHVGGEAMFFNVFAWIADRTEEPRYRGMLLDELVDALEDEGVSVGQTTNLTLEAVTASLSG